MLIRRAHTGDIAALDSLLHQVLDIHHQGRPDLFRAGTKKYTDAQLADLLADDSRPIFVAEMEGEVKGYAFCVIERHENDNILTDVKTLYIDDLCVDASARGQHIGQALYEYVLAYAKEIGCARLTLHVWSCNGEAMKFYEKMGLVPYRIGMEKQL